MSASDFSHFVSQIGCLNDISCNYSKLVNVSELFPILLSDCESPEKDHMIPVL